MDFINYMQPSYDSHEINAVVKYINSGAWITEFKETRNLNHIFPNIHIQSIAPL